MRSPNFKRLTGPSGEYQKAATCLTKKRAALLAFYDFAPAAVVAPFDYTALLWATVLGWLIWSEMPDLATYVGAGIIILSGLFIVFRERQLDE